MSIGLCRGKYNGGPWLSFFARRMMITYDYIHEKIIEKVKSLFVPTVRIAAYDDNEAFYKPKYSSQGAAGIDLITPVSIDLRPGESMEINTNVAMEIPENWVGLIVPKSGLGSKYHTQLANSVGVIDSDYRGEISVKISIPYNEDQDHLPLQLTQGDKFCQMLIVYCPSAKLETVEYCNLSKTERGEGGFGSTGK